MTVDFLKITEWSKLREKCDALGWTTPDKFSSRVVVAKDEAEEIVGFAVIQLITHVEPVWVADSQRSVDLLESMMGLVAGVVASTPVIAHTTSPQVARLLKIWGMEHLPHEMVFRTRATQGGIPA